MESIKKYIIKKLNVLKNDQIYKEIFAVSSLKGDDRYNKIITRDFRDLAILGDRFWVYVLLNYKIATEPQCSKQCLVFFI